MAEYKQVSSATAYPKSGKQSKQKPQSRQVKEVMPDSMYDAADIGSVPPSERTFDSNQYAKMPKDRKRQGVGDMEGEIRTDSYIFDTFKRWR